MCFNEGYCWYFTLVQPYKKETCYTARNPFSSGNEPMKKILSITEDMGKRELVI